MKIELKAVTVRELTDGYKDSKDLGVRAYGGALDVRPPYQREFVYKDKQRDAVIDTVRRNFPLNVLYWGTRDLPGADEPSSEVIDGQQRVISICQFVGGEFAIDGRYFYNLTSDEKEQILDYTLMVYFCTGTDSERLAWFRTINIAGVVLTDQELRNAVYAGPWVSDAKRFFSKPECPAYTVGSDHVSGSPIRQDYFETAINWISNGDTETYMATHQHKPNANELWLYFQSVLAWVKSTFPVLRREMKSVNWGKLYNEFKDAELDPAGLEARLSVLMADDDVTKKRGTYVYVLDGQERNLNIRAFTANQKREAYERQGGICPDCDGHFELAGMEADHITPWHLGGKTVAANCRMLCKEDNRIKGGA